MNDTLKKYYCRKNISFNVHQLLNYMYERFISTLCINSQYLLDIYSNFPQWKR